MMKTWTPPLYIQIIFIKLSICITGSLTIDCFKCTSFEGSAPWCEDPFHNNYSTTILHSPCWAGRKGRDGVYPATACVKLNGRFEDTGETMIVRDCALDSGSLTIDTELVRMSHCGGFYFGTRYVRGCVQSCFEDACNHCGDQWHRSQSLTLITMLVPLSTLICLAML